MTGTRKTEFWLVGIERGDRQINPSLKIQRDDTVWELPGICFIRINSVSIRFIFYGFLFLSVGVCSSRDYLKGCVKSRRDQELK